MIVINRKRLLSILSMICLSVLAFSFKIAQNPRTVETVALPVSNKVIVIDARTSEYQMNGAQSSSRNNRGTNEPKNCIKVTKLARTKWINSYINT